MSDLTRRDAVKMLASVPIAAGLVCSPPAVERAWARVVAARESRGRDGGAGLDAGLVFFTPHEWDTVRVLVDLVLPADERSGSATDAGVPEFMDFILDETEGLQTPIRGGLGWLDTECRRRFDRAFIECAEEERTAVLDDIAWPGRASIEHAAGVAFFNRFRDLTASGFFSSRMGVEDLGYQGNTVLQEWTGCPPEVLDRLGVSYDD